MGFSLTPPYSFTQASKQYKNFGKEKLKVGRGDQPINKKYWVDIKSEILRITKKGGEMISFGWHSNSIGKESKSEILEILLVPHGSSRNDTICVVEKKL